MRVCGFYPGVMFVLLLALPAQLKAQTQVPGQIPVQTEAQTLAQTPVQVPVKVQPKAPTRAETLADIRQELGFLHVEIQGLRRQMSTTGPGQQIVGGTEIERLNAIEGELQRLTGRVERMQFHIERIVKDGTNRIGDLEYRLVKLEGGDTSKLGKTTTLGGNTQKIDTPLVPPVTPTTTPAQTATPSVPSSGNLAVSEQADFNAAKAAYEKGTYQQAVALLSAFVKNYPSSPLGAGAYYWRGEAYAGLDKWSNAARSFLKSFSGAPNSNFAPRALYRLGVSLDKIGQRDEACLTLKEVGTRYPGSQSQTDAQQEIDTLQCSG